MTDDLKYRLKVIFAEVFETTPNGISEDCSIDNLPSWDSMQSVVLSSTVEAEFGIEFSDAELVSLNSFRKILAIVEAKTILGRSA